MKAVGLTLLVLLVALLALLSFNALRFTPEPVERAPGADLAAVAIDADAAARRLAEAVRFPTISHLDRSRTDTTAFLGFHGYLRQTFPLVHRHLEREVVSDLSLLYTWPGRDPSAQAVLLLAHMDVVPVTSGSGADWTHEPFAGVVADGYVYGRGTLDDKSSLMAIMEAAEALLADGFSPDRTIYLAFGHDEETGGTGAERIASLLESRGVRLELVLDEGGFIAEGLIDGMTEPVALIGVAEKGYLSLELSATGDGGHSSAPPENTSVGILARAIARLEENQFPARVDGGTRLMLEHVGPHQSFGRRLVLANLWLFEPLVARMLLSDPTTAATVRTTTAPTMFSGSDKDNVLPIRATAVVNFRILPGETRESVTERVRRVVDDERVSLRPLEGVGGSEPSPVSDLSSPSYRALVATIRQVAPEAVVTPYLVTGGTDSRFYVGLTDNVYRFLGVTLTSEQVPGVHGTDERTRVVEHARAIVTYHHFLRNTSDLRGTPEGQPATPLPDE